MSTVNDSVRGQRSVKTRRANGRMDDKVKKMTKDVRKMGRTTDAVEEHPGNPRKGISEYEDRSRDKIQHAERTVEQVIRERPLRAVLIAAGVGLLFGRLWRRH